MAILFRLELLIKNMKATTEKPSTPSGDGKTFSKDLRVLFTSSLRMLKMLTPTVQISNQMLSSGGILQISRRCRLEVLYKLAITRSRPEVFYKLAIRRSRPEVFYKLAIRRCRPEVLYKKVVHKSFFVLNVSLGS